MATEFAMKPEDAYLCAIDLIYELASAGWEDTIPSGHKGFSEEVNGVKIGMGSITQPGDRYQLQNKHIVIGLLEILKVLDGRDQFCFTQAALYLYRKHIGEMAIGRRAPDTMAGVRDADVTLSERSPIRNATKSQISAAAGKIVDPEDKNFVISYKLRGDIIPCRTLLKAAFNGMVQSAVAQDNRPCRDFAGFSSSGKVTYSITANSPGTSQYPLTYILVRTALKLLPAKLYGLERCGAVDFELIYEDEKIGIGAIYLSDFRTKNRVAVR